ncbi:MAG: glycosyltransferase family 2 protein [Deltaproteobacteria bacterium]|nr:glycosyltransferase family 2 protein [Deltaproteobacteria bacterium]
MLMLLAVFSWAVIIAFAFVMYGGFRMQDPPLSPLQSIVTVAVIFVLAYAVEGSSSRDRIRSRLMPLNLISRPYRHTVGAMPIVCAVKNELNLLPHFLRHHRELGFEHFIFIDNDSDDGTTDYLVGQPDCVVYQTAESYRLTRGGVNWISDLLNIHVRGDWGIFLDCDELLVYQDMETTSFSTYFRRYATERVDSFYALMIDLYPDGSWTGVSARTSSSLLAHMNCFDKDYVIRAAPHRPWLTLHPDAIEVLGGPRCRLFSTPGPRLAAWVDPLWIRGSSRSVCGQSTAVADANVGGCLAAHTASLLQNTGESNHRKLPVPVLARIYQSSKGCGYAWHPSFQILRRTERSL